MKKIYKYSESKFLGFTQQKQLAIVQEMLEVLEKHFDIEEYALALQESLSECFMFFSNSQLFIDISWHNYDLSKLSKVIELRDILLEKQGKYLKDTDIIVKRYDAINDTVYKFPIVVVLDNLRSAFNVGSIIRSSECLGVSEIALCGKTPKAENRKVVETAMGTVDFIKSVRYESTPLAISNYQEQGFEIIALELTNNSISLNNYKPARKVALVVGNESLGVAEETLSLCDKIIEIKMYGIKNSLNVSNATSIAVHNIIQKLEGSNDK